MGVGRLRGGKGQGASGRWDAFVVVNADHTDDHTTFTLKVDVEYIIVKDMELVVHPIGIWAA